MSFFFFFQAEDGIRDLIVTGVQTCALPICRGHRRAVDAVASRLRSDVDHRVADAGRGAFENLLALRDAEGEDVDEDVAVVGRMKGRFAPDGGDADAVAVAADAAHDAV